MTTNATGVSAPPKTRRLLFIGVAFVLFSLPEVFLVFASSSIGPVLYDGADYWRITINTSGVLRTTKI